MSVKLEFFKKLQARQPEPASTISKSQTDIVEFRLRMVQLQDQIDAWLMGTGLTLEMLTTSVTDLLVEGGAFDISGRRKKKSSALLSGKKSLKKHYWLLKALIKKSWRSSARNWSKKSRTYISNMNEPNPWPSSRSRDMCM